MLLYTRHTIGRYIATIFLLTTMLVPGPRAVVCQETEFGDAESENISPIQRLNEAWQDWPESGNFKISVEYRNYTYFHGEERGDSRDHMNEGRLRIEYDRDIRDNMRLYINGLFQVDDANFTHGFVDDFEDDDLKRNYFNFTEAFLDIYFDDFDLRLGKQIVNWGKADAANPTGNVSPSDYSNLLDDEDIGVVAVNLNYFFENWDLQIVGVPGFTPARLPPRGTRFSVYPPDSPLPIEDPELPSNTIDNSQIGVRAQTTHDGWDFSVSYYDGITSFPAATVRYFQGPLPIPVAIVPKYNRFRAIGADFATTNGRWGYHGEVARVEFDGDADDARFEYVIGLDYTRSDILFDHDLFIIVEYIGEEVFREGEAPDLGGTPLDRIFRSAFATNITYEFSDYTRLEIQGAVDLYQGNDYFLQPQLVHDLTDNFEITVGLDIIGGPRDTFMGQFKNNDRVFAKLKYTF